MEEETQREVVSIQDERHTLEIVKISSSVEF